MPDFSRFTTLPFNDPILIFACALIVFLVVPMAFERLRIPGILGLVLMGAVIGPNGFGVLERDTTFELMGRVGLLYIFFMAALEIDLKEFARNRKNSITFGLFSFMIPQVFGAIGAVVLFDFSWTAAILLGSMFGSHTLLAYPVASKLGISRSRIVTTGVGGTIITDTFAVLILAVIAASQRGEVGLRFWAVLIPSIFLYVAAIFLLVPSLARWFFRSAKAGGVVEFMFLMTVVYGCAALAPLAQLEPIIGAFLAGFALNPFVPRSGPLMSRVEFLGQSLFIPFFLVATGMLVDVRILVSDMSALAIAVYMVVAVAATKFLAALITKGIFKYTKAEMFVLFGLTVPQAAATLAAVFVGLQIGILGSEVLNGAILMILVSCLIGPLTIQKYGPAVAMAEAEASDVNTTEIQRILVPLANPKTAQELVGVALMLRKKGEKEPLLPICVVPEEAEVVRSERLLVEAVVSASEADVESEPLTRIDRNPASGILRAAQEKRASDVIIGWNGAQSPGTTIFGSIIDQVVEASPQQVIIAKLGHPIATSTRLIVILPTSIVYHPGYFYAIQSIKRLTSELGVSLHVIAVRTDITDVKKALKRAGLDIVYTNEEVPDWSEVKPRLESTATKDDMVVLVSSRRGGIGYSRALRRMPMILSGMDLTFMVLHPRTVLVSSGKTQAGLPDFLEEKNIIFNPKASNFPDVVKSLVQTEFELNSYRWKTAVDGIVKDEFAIALLRDSRIILAHTRVRGIKNSKLLLALKPTGIHHPQSNVTTNIVAVVLFPIDYSAQKHLAMLARTAQFFSNKEQVAALGNVSNMEDFMAWLHVKHADDDDES